MRELRRGLALTQHTLAARAAVQRSSIADVERGARNVTLRTLATLSQALDVGVGTLFAHATAAKGSAPPNGNGATAVEVREILLVEHNAPAAAAMALAFKRARLANPLHVVRDGEAALDYLFGTGRTAKRTPARPKLILLVPDLPRMSAKAFLQCVKADARTRDIPVVVLNVAA